MKQEIKIYVNKKLFIFTSILIFWLCIGNWVFIYSLLTDNFREHLLPRNAAGLGVYTVMALIVFVCFLASDANAHMVFTKNGIEFRRWFKKPEFHSYKEYAYVEKAFYMYYGMPQYYIVLSNWRLSELHRASINGVAATPNCIKIRYKKKEYEALMSIVPPRIASTIRAKFNDVPFGKFDFLFL